jgi:hypothetical protein
MSARTFSRHFKKKPDYFQRLEAKNANSGVRIHAEENKSVTAVALDGDFKHRSV